MTSNVRRFMRSTLAVTILLGLTLNTADAAIYNWNFNSTSGYTFNSGQIEFVDGVARLRKTNIVHNDNSEREFGGGEKQNVEWDAVTNKLRLTPGFASGSITSYIIDSFEDNHIWDRLNWLPERAYNKPIVNNGGSDSGYEVNFAGGQHTVGHYHFDETSGSTTFNNSARNSFHATCTDNCPTTTPGFYSNALELSGTQSLSIADTAESLSFLDDMADYRGVQFLYQAPTEALAYKRTITLSAPSQAANLPYRFELTPATFDYSKVRADGGDIRIWEPQSQQWLHYWIESWNPGGTSSIWVRLLDAGTSSFEMHYGNPVMETTSSPRDIFQHFDDFEREGVDRTQWRLGEGGYAGPATGRSFFVNNGKLISEMITSPDEDTIMGLYTATDPALDPQNAGEFKAIITLKEVGDAAQVRPKYVVEMGNSDSVQRKIRFEWYADGNTSGRNYRIGFGERVDYYAGEVYNYTTTVSNANRHLPVGVPYELTIQRVYTGSTAATVTVHAKPVIEGSGPEWTEVASGTLQNSTTDSFVVRFGFGYLGEVWTEIMRANAFDTNQPTLSVGTETSSTKRIAYNEGFLYERPVLLSTPTSENNMVIPVQIVGDSFYKRMHPNGNDIRFVDANGTNIPYFIEALGNTSMIWVKIPQAGTSEITMLYGNPYLPAASDPGIFDFYDDFSYTDTNGAPAIDPDKWEIIDYTGPADYSSIKIRREAVHNFSANGQGFTLKSKEQLTGAKSLRISMQKAGIAAGRMFCYGYGQKEPGGTITSKGFTSTSSVAIQNIQTVTDGDVCPEKIRTPSLSTGFNTTLQYGTDPVYYYVEDLHMSPTLGTRNFVRSMYYDNIQYPTDELAASEMGPTSGNVFMKFLGNSKTRVTYIFAYPQYESTPSVTLGTERMSGIGKGASYMMGMVRGIMMSANTGMQRLHGGYIDEGWNTVSQIPILSGSYNGGVQGDFIYINGKRVSRAPDGTGAVNNEPFHIGGNTVHTPKLTGLIDEVYLYKWIAGDTNYFKRHMGDIRFQLRSCDIADCSDGGEFIGPDGTSSTFWNERINSLNTTPANTVSSVPTGRYLQYKIVFEEKRPGVTPALSSMTLGQGIAFTTKPTIVFQTGSNQYFTLENAALTLGGKNVGNVRFQLGANYTTAPTGTRWHYWNGTTWVLANTTANVAETNTIDELNGAISFFPAQRSAGTVNPRYLYVRAFLDSEIGEPVEIDNLSISYYNTDTAPSAAADLYANDTLEGAQSGDVSPVSLDGLSAVVSARYVDPDVADVAYKYVLQVARDAGFTDLVYNSDTVTAGGISMPPLRNGNRSMNLPIPDGLIEYNTTYHWRVAFVDGSGKQGAFATAVFSAPDTTAPDVVIAPADGSTHIARNSSITVTVTDEKLGVDPASMSVNVRGVPAYVSETCQNGFSCSITPVASGYEIVITPDNAFDYGINVTVTASANDGANTGSSSSTFTTIPNGAPEAPEDLFANTETIGALSGAVNPERLDIGGIGGNIALSARFVDADADDEATAYRLEIARDNSFSSGSLLYSTNTAYPDGVTISTPLLDGERLPDVLVSSNTMELETTYFWRIQFRDAYNNWGAFSPSGADSARFSLADTAAPIIHQVTPADQATSVARGSTIEFTIEDAGSDIAITSLQTVIAGTNAITDGVCQAGFFCNITPVDAMDPARGYIVQITPADLFPSSTNIDLEVRVQDNAGVANESSINYTFTTAYTSPGVPSDLQAGTDTIPQSINPDDLDSTRVLLSALYQDDDAADTATAYELEVASDTAFTNIVYTHQSTFDIPVINGERTPDMIVPGNILQLETPYFWRVRFTDSQNMTGAFSPDGGNAATFTVIDMLPPVVLDAETLPNNQTLTSRTTPVRIVMTDNMPIDANRLQLSLDGTPIITNGVCSAGYTCIVSVDNTKVDINIMPESGFSLGTHALEVRLSDGRQETTMTRTFTITTPPVVPTPPAASPVMPGAGGGFAAPTTSGPAGQTSPAPVQVRPLIIPSAKNLGEVVVKTLTETFIDRVTNDSGQTSVAPLLQEILAPLVGGAGSSNGASTPNEQGVSGMQGAAGGAFPAIPVISLRPEQTSDTQTRPSAADLAKGPVLLLEQEENPPRHREIAFEQSLCKDLQIRHNYTVGENVQGLLRAQIATLRDIGVDFSNGGRDLELRSQVTRSELLRYLLQANCGIFDRDISGVPRFPDVAETHPDYLYVMLARKYGYVSGYLHDGLFRPDQAIDRAEALKIILEVFTKGRIDKTQNQPLYFLDVRQDDWFRGYIVAGTVAAVVDTQNSNFRPHDRLTLEEIIMLLARSLSIRTE